LELFAAAKSRASVEFASREVLAIVYVPGLFGINIDLTLSRSKVAFNDLKVSAAHFALLSEGMAMDIKFNCAQIPEPLGKSIERSD
jgi:hypothetical protein